jgi:hypothetical protein
LEEIVVNLYNPNDTITGRPDGVYLDQEEARVAEAERARREGRKPEEGFVPYVGTQVVTGGQLLAQGTAHMIPSEVERLNETTNDGQILAKPVGEVDSTDGPGKFVPGSFLNTTDVSVEEPEISSGGQDESGTSTIEGLIPPTPERTE